MFHLSQLLYIVHMRLNIKYKSTKNEKNDFKETELNERFGESHMYKVTN